MRISFPWLDLRQYFSSVSSIWLVGRVGSNSLPHRPSSLPYCSAFSPGIRRADIRRTFSGYLSFPFVSSTTPNQKLYLSGGYPASGYLVRLLSLVQQAAATAGGAATSNKTAAPKARRGRAASGTSDPEGGYTPDIHDVTDGILKLRKTYNYKNNYIYWNHHGALISNNKK